MMQVVSIEKRDYALSGSSDTFFLPDGINQQLAIDSAALIQGASDGDDYKVRLTQTLGFIPGARGRYSATGTAGQAARLDFGTLAGVWSLYVSAPTPRCFLADGTVDQSFSPMASLISWMLANAISDQENALTSYHGGKRVVSLAGPGALYGAASTVRVQGFQADWEVSDGANAKAG